MDVSREVCGVGFEKGCGCTTWALRWGSVAGFTLYFLALIPLVLLLGSVTEGQGMSGRFAEVLPCYFEKE